MLQVRNDLIQRVQDEPSLMQSGMRDRQIRLLDYFIPVKEDVHIDRARSESYGPLAAEKLLDFLTGPEKLPGGKQCIDGDNAINKPILIGAFEGRRFVQG